MLHMTENKENKENEENEERKVRGNRYFYCVLFSFPQFCLPVDPRLEGFCSWSINTYRSRGEIGGNYLPSQLESTPQLCS